MVLDAGDVKYQPGQTVTLDSASNTVGGGEAVTFDSSGDIKRATDSDLLVGTTLDVLRGSDADDQWPVTIAGLGVVVEVDSTFNASAGDWLEPNSDGDGTYQDAGAAGPDSSLPWVLEPEDASNDLYVAVFR